MALRRAVHRLHPALSDVLDRLEHSPLGAALTDRLTDVLTRTMLEPPVDHRDALAPHLWVLERAGDGGLPLTAAGYLKPADVKALAALLPEMHHWTFPINREVDSHPVLYFRSYLQGIGLLRKYKGALLSTRLGKQLATDPAALWQHLADALLPLHPGFDSGEMSFETDAAVLVLAHMATQGETRLETQVIARTLDALGWQHRDGSAVMAREVWPVANEKWLAVGNVGQPRSARMSERVPSAAGIRLICDALFTDVTPA
jgi:hypothetical protein